MKFLLSYIFLISIAINFSCERPHCPNPLVNNSNQNNTGSTSSQISTWQLKTVSNISGDFLDTDFANELTGYIVGYGGVIVKTSDGGKTFTALNSGTNQDLYAVHCISSQIAVVVGNGGTILKTIDGGLNWTPISATSNSLRNVYFYNSSIGYITGGNGTVLKTTDGGLTWNTINVGTTNALYGIFFTDVNTGYLSGLNGLILKTTNGGNSWTSQESGVPIGPIILNSIYFTDANHGIIAAGIGNPSFTPNPIILRTTDGGENWNFVNCPTSNDDYFKVKFVDSNIGYIIGGYVEMNTGVILKTTDGGASWTSIPISSSRLTGLKIINSGDAFTVGYNTTIIQGM